MSLWRRWIEQPQSTLGRRVLFQIHLCTGLAIGLYVFTIFLSGSVLVYRNELYRMFSPGPDGPLPLGYRLTSWLLDFHANLLGGETGRRVNGYGGLLVLVLCVTGAVIWWPGSRQWRRSLTVSVRPGAKRVTWRLHSAAGFWLFGFIVLFGITGAYLALPGPSAALFDTIQPYDEVNPGGRLVDRIQYWLAYLHFGRLGGRGIPWCGRGLCNSITKATWATAGLVGPVMFVTGALLWRNRVLRPARRRLEQAEVR